MYILSSYIMSTNTNQKPTTNDKNSEISVNHQKLIDATIETIAKRGLADTTISHVAKKAEVSQGYANFRFKSKENLLLSSLQFLSDEYKKSWQKIFEDENLDPIDRLLRICENDFSKIETPLYADREPVFYSLAYGQFTQEEFRNGWALSILDGR